MVIEHASGYGQDFDAAMIRALEVAQRGPTHGANPQVGCLILHPITGATLAEGAHLGVGTPHAEIAALSALPNPESARGAIAVVTLEPCNHEGHTGPCSKALIEAGIGTVVFGVRDPSPEAGGGAETLSAAGIRVIGGVLEDHVEEALRVWLTAVRLRRPFITIKSATSLDGRTAAQDGSSQWISCRESRAHSHRLRAEADAILVGTGTVIDDDPALTARHPDGSLYEHQPVPVVIGQRELPPAAKIFQSTRPPIQYRHHSPREALSDMFDQGIRHVIVEGGPTIISAFVGEHLVDEFVMYVAPKLLGGWRLGITQIGVTNIAAAHELSIEAVERIGEDILIRATPKRGPRPHRVVEPV